LRQEYTYVIRKKELNQTYMIGGKKLVAILRDCRGINYNYLVPNLYAYFTSEIHSNIYNSLNFNAVSVFVMIME